MEEVNTKDFLNEIGPTASGHLWDLFCLWDKIRPEHLHINKPFFDIPGTSLKAQTWLTTSPIHLLCCNPTPDFKKLEKILEDDPTQIQTGLNSITCVGYNTIGRDGSICLSYKLGVSPLFLAICVSKNIDLISFLFLHGANPNALHESVTYKGHKTTHNLIDSCLSSILPKISSSKQTTGSITNQNWKLIFDLFIQNYLQLSKNLITEIITKTAIPEIFFYIFKIFLQKKIIFSKEEILFAACSSLQYPLIDQLILFNFEKALNLKEISKGNSILLSSLTFKPYRINMYGKKCPLTLKELSIRGLTSIEGFDFGSLDEGILDILIP